MCITSGFFPEQRNRLLQKYTPVFISCKRENCLQIWNAGLSAFVTPLQISKTLGPGFSQASDSQHLVLLLPPVFSAGRKHWAQEWKFTPDIIAKEFLFSSPHHVLHRSLWLFSLQPIIEFSQKSVPIFLSWDFLFHPTLENQEVYDDNTRRPCLILPASPAAGSSPHTPSVDICSANEWTNAWMFNVVREWTSHQSQEIHQSKWPGE